MTSRYNVYKFGAVVVAVLVVLYLMLYMAYTKTMLPWILNTPSGAVDAVS